MNLRRLSSVQFSQIKKKYGSTDFQSRTDWYYTLVRLPCYKPANTNFCFELGSISGRYDSRDPYIVDRDKPFGRHNIHIRPKMLNTKYPLRECDFYDINRIRYATRDRKKLTAVAKELYKKFIKMKIDTKLFISQGGRCAYTGVPMTFDKEDRYFLTKTKIRNKTQYVIQALHSKYFDQQYWDMSTGIFETEDNLIQALSKDEKKILNELLQERIKTRSFVQQANNIYINTKQLIRCCGPEPGKHHYALQNDMCKNKKRTGGFGTQCKKCMMIRKQKYKKRKFEEVS